MSNKPIYTSKTPISFVIGSLISVVCYVFFIIKVEFPDSLIYPTIIFGFWFFTISHYACRLKIFSDKIVVEYIAFWIPNTEINLTDKNKIDVRLNYWSFSSRYSGHWHKEYICYDQIDFINKENESERLKINVRIGQSNKVYDTLEKLIRNNNR
ncbi:MULTISPECIES: hypothetical protein [unclassified Carboxylicivirga]|uniref:hypothetical protein n=1 Tax=Carboxylicivirga TaxID=1628153 RepID=UPI003D3453C1